MGQENQGHEPPPSLNTVGIVLEVLAGIYLLSQENGIFKLAGFAMVIDALGLDGNWAAAALNGLFYRD